ncbi:hypothetical protein F4808DRAFT_465723 [Astrocystis sublimbata]|nr:hypothetical protein F4808DRAFT_465723 [Astrocystis sublimbata]
MHSIYSAIILLSGASALDIRFWTGPNCGGTAMICGGFNPDACCGQGFTQSGSVGFYGIPPSWDITCTTFQGDGCQFQKDSTRIRGQNFACQSSGSYSGAKYTFNNNKIAARGAQGACKRTQKPDTLMLEDGTRYNLQELHDDQIHKMLLLAYWTNQSGMFSIGATVNATTAADVPSEFNHLKM